MGDLRLGIDIGSTTVKLVLIDENLNTLHKIYQRHFSEPVQALKKYFKEFQPYLKEAEFYVTFSGSAAMGIAQKLNYAFEQEVLSCSTAIKRFNPETDTAVELGGEDAKITYFKGSLEQRMNGACAGGTGAFIDQMASLLNTDAQGLNELAQKGNKVHTIASRCGVFAKTDIQALINDGVVKEDLALSILQAVVNQTVGTLAQGRPIEGKTAFLGGPLSFLPCLKECFVKTLQLTPENIVNPKDPLYFVALGAALSESASKTNVEDFLNNLDKLSVHEHASVQNNPPLFKNQEEYQLFKLRHEQTKVKRGDLGKHYRSDALLFIKAITFYH